MLLNNYHLRSKPQQFIYTTESNSKSTSQKFANYISLCIEKISTETLSKFTPNISADQTSFTKVQFENNSSIFIFILWLNNMGNSSGKQRSTTSQSTRNRNLSDPVSKDGTSTSEKPLSVTSQNIKTAAKRSQSLRQPPSTGRPVKKGGVVNLNDDDVQTPMAQANGTGIAMTRSSSEVMKNSTGKKLTDGANSRKISEAVPASRRKTSSGALKSSNSIDSGDGLQYPSGFKRPDATPETKAKKLSLFKKAPKKQPSINPNQITLIKESWETSPHGELGTRIYSRLFQKRPDIKSAYERISQARPECHWKHECREFTEFLDILVENLEQIEVVQIRCWERGAAFAGLREFGFKPQFWVPMSEIMTTECLYLDRGLHPVADVVDAWACLISLMLTYMRDGFYNELRINRRESKRLLTRGSTAPVSESASSETISAEALSQLAIASAAAAGSSSPYSLSQIPSILHGDNLERRSSAASPRSSFDIGKVGRNDSIGDAWGYPHDETQSETGGYYLAPTGNDLRADGISCRGSTRQNSQESVSMSACTTHTSSNNDQRSNRVIENYQKHHINHQSLNQSQSMRGAAITSNYAGNNQNPTVYQNGGGPGHQNIIGQVRHITPDHIHPTQRPTSLPPLQPYYSSPVGVPPPAYSGGAISTGKVLYKREDLFGTPPTSPTKQVHHLGTGSPGGYPRTSPSGSYANGQGNNSYLTQISENESY